jgi:hypothetical protein
MHLEDMVAEVIGRFCYFYPKQVDALKRYMANVRAIQSTDTATSDLVGYIGEIPIELNAMMVLNIGPHWRRDPEVRNIFWRMFRIGRVNQRNRYAGDSHK